MEAVDPALRRSGRFDAEIEVTTPTEDERFQILKVSDFFPHNYMEYAITFSVM